MGFRKFKLKHFKAWPLLVILSMIYVAREHMGVSDVSDVNDFSSAVLPIALIIFAVALLWFVLKLFSRSE